MKNVRLSYSTVKFSHAELDYYKSVINRNIVEIAAQIVNAFKKLDLSFTRDHLKDVRHGCYLSY